MCVKERERKREREEERDRETECEAPVCCVKKIKNNVLEIFS